VAAHPDDAEEGCGGTVAKWIQEGCQVYFLIATNGNKGDDTGNYTSAQLAAVRAREQSRAAKVIGVTETVILDRDDGTLVADDGLRADVVRWIRTWKPDVVFTHDPTVVFMPDGGINHNDHRAIGLATVDSVYPYSRGVHQYPEQIEEGLETHTVAELYVWHSDKPNTWVDIGDTLDTKIEALECHGSQFPDQKALARWIKGMARRQAKGKKNARYAESFRRIRLMV